jgi:hypothetical protein
LNLLAVQSLWVISCFRIATSGVASKQSGCTAGALEHRHDVSPAALLLCSITEPVAQQAAPSCSPERTGWFRRMENGGTATASGILVSMLLDGGWL